MPAKIALIFIGLLTALNIGMFALNVSTASRAEVAGMGQRDLERDRDFKRAVESIVESCTVDGESISC